MLSGVLARFVRKYLPRTEGWLLLCTVSNAQSLTEGATTMYGLISRSVTVNPETSFRQDPDREQVPL